MLTQSVLLAKLKGKAISFVYRCSLVLFDRNQLTSKMHAVRKLALVALLLAYLVSGTAAGYARTFADSSLGTRVFVDQLPDGTAFCWFFSPPSSNPFSHQQACRKHK